MAYDPLTAPLFVPATYPERFAKAAASGADVIIVDLEDAVPSDLKEAVRSNLTAIASIRVPAFIRINAVGTPWFEADLEALRAIAATEICVPKVEHPDLIDKVVMALGTNVRVLAQIETANGLRRAIDIVSHPSVSQLAFGPADFFLDMQVAASSALTSFALSTMAVASRAAGKPLPLDGPSFAVADKDLVLQECRMAAGCGAGGKLCIHPAQVDSVLKAFAPSEEEVAWARRVIACDKQGAAAMVDGQMIDAPVVAQARRVVSRASRGANNERAEPHN